MMHEHERTTRRSIMATGTAGLALGLIGTSTAQDTTPAPRKRVLRLAHLTDTHVQPERDAGRGFATCLKQVQADPDPPSMILFGGDNVMNVDSEDGRERAGVQLATWNDVLKQECSLPYRTVIGNHDVLGLDPVDGKKWAVDAYGLPGRYYDWEASGWHFIVLDSTSPNVLRGGEGGYKGLLDEAQFQWLAARLKRIPATTPICVVSHIPILAACTFFDGDNEETLDWVVPGAWMHVDARRIKDLFHEHPNVKLCLSGHIHLVDVVDYLGVRYACNGAVCGGWWDGNYHEFGPGYAMVDLYDDGSCEVDFNTYPWTPVPKES
ncbi:MAG: metallophosphoesterase [Phycisphaerales bacterium]|nr:metallophosphoesterase [Phycisphaerales bacterium]